MANKDQRSSLACGLAGVKVAGLLLLLLASAYIVALDTASHEQVRFSWLALFPLFIVIYAYQPCKAGVCGAGWGVSLSMFLVVAPGRLVELSMGSMALCIVIPSVYACLGAYLTRRIGFSPFVLSVGWMGVEFALEPLGVNRSLVASASGGTTLLHWVTNAFGYVLLGFFVAVVNAALIAVLSKVRIVIPQPAPPEKRGYETTILSAQTFSAFPLFAIPASSPRAPPPCGAHISRRPEQRNVPGCLAWAVRSREAELHPIKTGRNTGTLRAKCAR